MNPTFFDLAVAMNRLDIERVDAKLERMANLQADGSDDFGEKLGRLVSGFKSLLRQSNEMKGKSSSGSIASGIAD